MTTDTAWTLNRDKTIHTRHLEPAKWPSTTAVLNLTADQFRYYAAIHEAGHAALFLKHGAVVDYLRLLLDKADAGESGALRDAETALGEDWSMAANAYYEALAAGERAQDRWLREAGLWTSERAWATERLAGGDRDLAVRAMARLCGDSLTFGVSSGRTDYGTVCQAADTALGLLWGRVLALADVLTACGYVSGPDAKQIICSP